PCDGYFRHSKNDNNESKKYTKEWNELSNDEKNLIMKTTISQYLFILSILRDNNFPIQMIWNNSKGQYEK
ncbi:MAG: hypothetical protein K2L64_03050, partial [Ureaplasma sp.]|nr:hypothetical protein [Ureaplasma sp.]